MAEAKAEIGDVSDTALWVATHRAIESERPDAVFRDPLAAVLAGERGRRIARDMPAAGLMSWVMVVRTVGIDRLVQTAVAQGCDTVVNLGAGLDTRPYRLPLPPTLRWVEVDFPHLIALKDEKLADQTPGCRLERVAADLADDGARRAFLSQLGAGSQKVVAITEGLIPYLTPEQASALSADLLATPQVVSWIQDFHVGSLRKRSPPGWAKKLEAAPFRFDVDDWFGFFAQRGWTPEETIYTVDEAERIGRKLPFLFPRSLLFLLLPRKKREALRRARGYVRMKRA